MTEPKPTIGKAIDQILEALGAFEERDKGTILSTVYAHLQIAPPTSAAPVDFRVPLVEVTPKEHVPPAHSQHEAKSKHSLDIRTLKDQKQPNSARQMACIVAYYVQEHAPDDERKQTITTADLAKYFKQAGYKLPIKLEQLLAACRRSGYFDSTVRGEYKLTRVGYNLVTHSLPAKEKA